MTEPLAPSAALLAKLGSIAVHADEMLDEVLPLARAADEHALRSVLSDPDVRAWLGDMDAMALLPVKRAARLSTGDKTS